MDQPSVLEDPKYSYLVNVHPLFFRLWKKLFDIYCRFVFLWYTPLKITGQNHLPDSSYIFSCNHNSHMDVAILSVASGRGFNDFGMLAAKDYWFDSWVKRFVVNIVMNLIPIDRKADFSEGWMRATSPASMPWPRISRSTNAASVCWSMPA